MDSTDESLKTLTKGAGIIIIGIFISKILTLIYRIIIARTGTEPYGLLSLGIAITGVLITISILGLNIGIIRYVAYYLGKSDIEKVKGAIIFSTKIVFLLSGIFSLLLFFSSDWLAITIFKNAKLIIVLKLMSFVIPLTALSTIFLSVSKAFRKVEHEVYSRNILENLIKIIFTTLFLAFGLGVFGLTLAYVLATAGTLIISLYLLKKKIFPTIKTNLKPIFFKKELLYYSLPLLFVDFLISIMLWTDSFMLGYFKNISDVGIYNAALPLGHLIYIIPYALLTLFTPIATGLYSQNKKEEFKSFCKTTTKWIFLINLPILISFLFFSKQILRILFGLEYVVGWKVVIIIASTFFLYHLVGCSNNTLLILKKTKLVAFNTFTGTILNIVLNYFLVPLYGITGAAIATGSSFLFIAILFYLEAYSITRINPFKPVYFKIIFCALISALIIYGFKMFFNIENKFVLAGVLLMFVIIYLLALLITKTFEKDDIFIMRTIKQKTNLELPYIEKIIRKFI